MSRRIKDCEALLARSGAQQIEFDGITGHKHLRFQITAPNGTRRAFFMSATPSDKRGDLNKVSVVRRFCAENAVA